MNSATALWRLISKDPKPRATSDSWVFRVWWWLGAHGLYCFDWWWKRRVENRALLRQLRENRQRYLLHVVLMEYSFEQIKGLPLHVIESREELLEKLSDPAVIPVWRYSLEIFTWAGELGYDEKFRYVRNVEFTDGGVRTVTFKNGLTFIP